MISAHFPQPPADLRAQSTDELYRLVGIANIWVETFDLGDEEEAEARKLVAEIRDVIAERDRAEFESARRRRTAA